MITIGKLAVIAALCAGMVVGVWAAAAPAADAKAAVIDPPAEPADNAMGEYAGACKHAFGEPAEATATVVGYLDAKSKVMTWDVVLTAKGADKPLAKMKGTAAEDDKVALSGDGWKGEIAGGKLVAENRDKGSRAELKRTVRTGPTLGAKPPAGAVVLLPYEKDQPTNLEAWANDKWAIVSDGSAMVRGGSNLTAKQFGSFKLHVEFRCPYEPSHRGQGRANSGVYMHGKYEVQVLDSFGLKPGGGDCGAIYGVSVPKVNASLPPGQWQTYDVVFEAATFDADGKMTTKPKFVEVLHNGVKIHENVEVPGVTTAGHGSGHAPTGPLMLQDHGNPVRYRNIWLVETKGR